MGDLAPGTIVAKLRGRKPVTIAPSQAGSPAATLAMERAGFDFGGLGEKVGGYEYMLLVAWGECLARKATTASTVDDFAAELVGLEVVQLVEAPRPTRPRPELSPGSRSRSGSTRAQSSNGTAKPSARSVPSSTAKQAKKAKK